MNLLKAINNPVRLRNRSPTGKETPTIVQTGSLVAGRVQTQAEKLMEEWKKNPTQENFIEMVKKHSDDSSAKDGGLFENVSPDDNYVTEFLDWSLADGRKAGDCEIIETEFGYHLMYYVEDDEMTYRDLLISNEIKESEYTEWYEKTVEEVTVTEGNTDYLSRDYMLAALSSNNVSFS